MNRLILSGTPNVSKNKIIYNTVIGSRLRKVRLIFYKKDGFVHYDEFSTFIKVCTAPFMMKYDKLLSSDYEKFYRNKVCDMIDHLDILRTYDK